MTIYRTDVKFNDQGAPNSLEPADDCYGVADGNDDVATINALTWSNVSGYTRWDWSKNAIDGTATIGGITFAFTDVEAGTGASSPFSFTLAWSADAQPGTPPDYSFSSDIIFVVKQGDGFSAYLFDDTPFLSATNGQGEFVVNFGRGKGEAYSHFSAYFGDFKTTTSSTTSTTSTTGGSTTGSQEIPEPGSPLALIGLGAALVFLTRRRRAVAA